MIDRRDNALVLLFLDRDEEVSDEEEEMEFEPAMSKI